MTSIRYDTATESNGDGTDNITEPWDHITGDFSDRIMFVAVGFDPFTSNDIVGATYDGVALTELYRLQVASSSLWVGYLLNPNVGTHAVNLTSAPGDLAVARGASITFYNVYATDPIGQAVSSTSSNTIPTDYTDTINPDDSRGMIADFYFGSRGISGNAKSPQTEVINLTGTWGGGVNFFLGLSYLAHDGADTDMTWENLLHNSAAADQFHAVVELREKPVAGVFGATII